MRWKVYKINRKDLRHESIEWLLNELSATYEHPNAEWIKFVDEVYEPFVYTVIDRLIERTERGR